jgi:hypothetical protein
MNNLSLTQFFRNVSQPDKHVIFNLENAEILAMI